MVRLRGKGVGIGMALGTAAIVRTRSGIPLLPEAPPRLQRLAATGGLTEKPDVILVAEDYDAARTLAGALTWANVAGIAAASSRAETAVTNSPAVVDVANLLSFVEDDMLMLVDAENGVVLVDPDGMAVAQYQAEHDHIAPKRRLYIDVPHLPAQTTDGRVIKVIAQVDTPDSVAQALEEGADALYIPFDCELIPADASERAVDASLHRLIEATAGKTLYISDLYALPLLSILKAGSRADIVLALPPRDDLTGLGFHEMTEELTAVQAQAFEEEIPCGMPRLAANLIALDSDVDPDRDSEFVDLLSASGVSRLCVSLEESGGMLEELLPRLSNLIAAANTNLLPIICRDGAYNFMDETLETAVRALIGVGVSGILTWRPYEVKSLIRGLSYSECQEAMLGSAEGEPAV